MQLESVRAGDRHHEHVGFGGARDTGDQSGQAVGADAHPRDRIARRGGQRHHQRGGDLAPGQRGNRLAVTGTQQRDRGQDRARQEGHRRDGPADLLHDDRDLASTRAGTAERLGHQQPGHPELAGQSPPDG